MTTVSRIREEIMNRHATDSGSFKRAVGGFFVAAMALGSLAYFITVPGGDLVAAVLLSSASVFVAGYLTLRYVTRQSSVAGTPPQTLPAEKSVSPELLTSSHDIILLVTREGKIVSANEEAILAYGYAKGELEGMHARDLRAPDARTDLDRHLAQIQELGSLRFETVHCRRDGSTFPVETSARSIELEGQPYVLAIVRDITKRKRAESRLTTVRDCFLSFGADPVENINALVRLCGQMMGGATALYNRLDGGFLRSIGQWNAPTDLQVTDRPEGHVCYDLITATKDDLLVVRDLPLTKYFVADPNVKKYGLKTYIGHVVRFGQERIGSLCVLFNEDVDPSEEDRELMGIIAAAIGIEENRRHKERALSESEERYRRVVEFSPDPIAVHVGGKFVYVNRAGLRMIGAREMSELVGKPILGIVHPDSQEAMRSRMMEQSTAPVEQPFVEEKFVRLDGTAIDVEVATTPIFYEGNHATLVVARDLEDRRRAEEELVKLRKAVESSGEIIFTTNPDGIFTYVNPEFTRVYGHSAAEVIGKSTPRILKGGTLDASGYDSFWDSLLKRKIFKGEFENRKKSGELITVEVSASPIVGDKGAIIGFLSIQRDVSERKRVEDALRKSEASYRELFNSVGDAIYIQDRDGRFLDVNQGAVEMYGYARKDFLGKSPADLGAPGMNDLDATMKAVRKTFAGEPQRFEWWGRRKNGEIFPKEVRLNRSMYLGQEVVVALAQDITERRASVQRLQESEEKFRTLSEQSPNMIYINKGGRVVYVNQRAVEMMGYTKEEFYSQNFNFMNLIAPEHISLVKRNYGRHMSGQEIEPYEYGLLTKGGQRLIGINTTRLINYEGGPAILGIITDVTGTRMAEVELRKLHQAVEQSPSSILITDTEGKIEYVNRKFTEVTGYTIGEVLGKNPSILKSGHTPEGEYATMWEAVLSGKEWRGEFRNKKKNGELFWELASISPIRDSSGTITHLLAVKENITERKALEQQLLQAQKMESLGTLASGVAHDFNNILGIIIGYASLLDQKLNDPVRRATYLEAIVKAAERGAGLVRQILTFARKSDFTLEKVNVNSIIGELAKMLGETFPKTITLSLQLERALPLLAVDRTQLHQALLNLCVNARDAMGDKGSLTLSTRLVDGSTIARRFATAAGKTYAEIAVSDSGMGMNEGTKGRIFEPFFTTKEVGKGTGLGLSVVFGVVQEHQGFVDVESEIGMGSTFKIWLPVPEGIVPGPGATQRHTEDAPGGTETILVVEDEELMLDLVASVLEQKGYRVLLARDGEEAMKIHQANIGRIDLVLSDIGLPKLDGWESCQQMKQADPTMKIILASGYLEPELKSEIMKVGSIGLIRKPYSTLEILNNIRKALDEKNSQGNAGPF